MPRELPPSPFKAVFLPPSVDVDPINPPRFGMLFLAAVRKNSRDGQRNVMYRGHGTTRLKALESLRFEVLTALFRGDREEFGEMVEAAILAEKARTE